MHPKTNAVKVIEIYNNIVEKHTKTAPKFNQKSCEIQILRFLWFCKESNVLL